MMVEYTPIQYCVKRMYVSSSHKLKLPLITPIVKMRPGNERGKRREARQKDIIMP